MEPQPPRLAGRRGRRAYDKLHTFDVELGGVGTFQESAAVRPGENGPTLASIDALGLTLGMSICYDLRFPISTAPWHRRAPAC